MSTEPPLDFAALGPLAQRALAILFPLESMTIAELAPVLGCSVAVAEDVVEELLAADWIFVASVPGGPTNVSLHVAGRRAYERRRLPGVGE